MIARANESFADSKQETFPSAIGRDACLAKILKRNFGKDHDFALTTDADSAVSIARMLNSVLVRTNVHDERFVDSFQRLLEVRRGCLVTTDQF